LFQIVPQELSVYAKQDFKSISKTLQELGFCSKKRAEEFVFQFWEEFKVLTRHSLTQTSTNVSSLKLQQNFSISACRTGKAPVLCNISEYFRQNSLNI
jgi:hypothetical protein